MTQELQEFDIEFVEALKGDTSDMLKVMLMNTPPGTLGSFYDIAYAPKYQTFRGFVSRAIGPAFEAHCKKNGIDISDPEKKMAARESINFPTLMIANDNFFRPLRWEINDQDCPLHMEHYDLGLQFYDESIGQLTMNLTYLDRILRESTPTTMLKFTNRSLVKSLYNLFQAINPLQNNNQIVQTGSSGIVGMFLAPEIDSN